MQHTQDTITLKGSVDIQVFENDILIERMQDDNLVVTLGKTNITKLLGGDSAGKAITKIAVGTNGTAPVVGNTTITGMFSKSLEGATYPDAQSVLFNFDIDNAEANGITIREFGLLNTDNVVFARKVRDTEIIKTSAIRLVGTWKITIN